jgi:hypothetical protein
MSQKSALGIFPLYTQFLEELLLKIERAKNNAKNRARYVEGDEESPDGETEDKLKKAQDELYFNQDEGFDYTDLDAYVAILQAELEFAKLYKQLQVALKAEKEAADKIHLMESKSPRYQDMWKKMKAAKDADKPKNTDSTESKTD